MTFEKEIVMTNQMTVEVAERRIFLPAVNIYETESQIVLMSDMPGVDEKTVEIGLEGDVLTILGRSAVEAPKGMETAYAEYSSGDYRRSFTLSGDQIDRERIEATVKNGVLTVTLPKAEAAKPRRITVKAA
jgi:HSP20 family molecular chaperone IbpA